MQIIGFFVVGAGAGKISSPHQLVYGKLGRTKVNLLNQKLAVWWHQWGTEMTGWWSIQKTYSHNLLFYFILMIRLQNWQNCLWSIGEWHFIRNLKQNNTSPFRFKLINTWIIPLIIVQKYSKFCKGSLDQTLTTIWWRRIIFKNTRTNHG